MVSGPGGLPATVAVFVGAPITDDAPAEEMTVAELGRDVLRRWRIILVAALAALVVGLIYAVVFAPAGAFEATTVLRVEPDPLTRLAFGTVGEGQALASVTGQQIRNAGIPGDNPGASLQVTGDDVLRTVTVVVRAPTEEGARQAADAVIDQYVEVNEAETESRLGALSSSLNQQIARLDEEIAAEPPDSSARAVLLARRVQLQERVSEVQAAIDAGASSVTVIGRGEPVAVPPSPPPWLVVVGLVVAAVLVTLTVLGFRAPFRREVRTRRDIDAALGADRVPVCVLSGRGSDSSHDESQALGVMLDRIGADGPVSVVALEHDPAQLRELVSGTGRTVAIAVRVDPLQGCKVAEGPVVIGAVAGRTTVDDLALCFEQLGDEVRSRSVIALTGVPPREVRRASSPLR